MNIILINHLESRNHLQLLRIDWEYLTGETISLARLNKVIRAQRTIATK